MCFIIILDKYRVLENKHRIAMENTLTNPRLMKCDLGHLTRSDGNVMMSQGDTTVTVGVYGPAEVKISKEIVDRATVEVVYKPRSGLPVCGDKLFERTIRNTCETIIMTALHPRSSIGLIVQEMQNSGSFLACCINSCCLALLDASVSMKYQMAAVACSVDCNEKIILDPTLQQEKDSLATLTFVFDSKNYTVLTVSSKGQFTKEQFSLCMETCLEASKGVFQFYRDSFEKKLSK